MTSEYVFNIGDEVITVHGEKGEITDICDCEGCKKRGFYELTWEDEYEETHWITDYDAACDFKAYYKIGNHRFGSFEKAPVEDTIAIYERLLYKARKQILVIEEESNEEDHNNLA